MSTLQYNGNEYNILYIDGNIGASAGDGSTPAGALATIPSPLVDKTCYIIRRHGTDETVNVDMPQSWYESLQYIMFLGFPKADDPMYNLMEESAKTAWGSDTGNYARIRCNTSAQQDCYSQLTIGNTSNRTLLKTNSIRNFYAGNCYFYRDGNGHNSTANGRYMSWMFGFDYDSRFADVSFNNCKFGYAQYNLDNDDYINNNSDVATDTSKYPQNKARCYIVCRNANSFTMNNCIINQVYVMPYCRYEDWYQPHSKGIQIEEANKCIFTNNQLNILYRNSNTSYYSDFTEKQWNSCTRLQIGERGNCFVKNIEINKIFTATNARGVANTFFAYAQSRLEIDDIRFNVKVMGGGNTFSTSSFDVTNPVISASGINSLKVNNLYTNLSQKDVASIYFVYISSMQSSVGNISTDVNNIYAKFSQSGNNFGGNIVFIDNTYYTWNNDTAIANITSNSVWHERAYGRSESKAWIAKNVVVDAPSHSGYALYLQRCGVKSPYIRGRVYLGHASLDLKKQYWFHSTTTGAVIRGNSYYKCDDFEADLTYPGYNGTTLIDWQSQSMSSVYVNKSNCILTDEKYITPIYLGSSNNSFICPNYIKTGQFFQRNEVCFAKSWNTVRTGSNSQGSLRFNNNSADVNNNSHPLIIGQDPYSGIQIVPSSIGKKILTAYIATKNMDVSEFGYTGRIGIHVICPEKYTDYFDVGKQNTKLHEFTSEANGWQADNSSWSGDTNLNTFKCEIPIEVFTLEEPIDVKIWFNWYSVSGYLYVDPDFKVVDVI